MHDALLWTIRGTDLGLRERQVARGRGLEERKKVVEGICLEWKAETAKSQVGAEGGRRLLPMRKGQREVE